MKDIKGYEGQYAITRDGRVWSYPREIVKKDRWGKINKFKWKGGWLKSNTTKKGDWYMSISLRRKNRKGFKIHRLVAKAFIPNPKGLLEINHKNGIKGDNRVKNLEWCSRQDNIDHSWKILPKRNHQRGEKNYWSKLTEKDVRQIRNLAKKGSSGRSLAPVYGVSATTINGIIKGVYWKHVKV